jgi:hypothetical protein
MLAVIAGGCRFISIGLAALDTVPNTLHRRGGHACVYSGTLFPAREIVGWSSSGSFIGEVSVASGFKRFFCPGIAECYRSIENGLVGRTVFVEREIAKPFKLIARLRFCDSQ